MAKIAKWGNSRALHIPKALAQEVGLDYGSEVDLIVDNGQLRIVPCKKTPRYTLEELVAGITPENRHDEWDIGPPVGKEVW